MKFLVKKNYFFYLLALSFVFVSTTAMSLSKSFSNAGKMPQISFSIKDFPDNPVLKTDANFPILSAQGVIATDLDSGVTLYEKNPDVKLLPASTTKIITALVTLEVYSPDQIITVPKGINIDGQKMGLYPGEQMSVINLLYGLLVYSANDAAMTLAINYPSGGYDAFIAAMNQKAAALSMFNTNFSNPVGLDTQGQATTAKDLLRASEVAMRIPKFADIVGTKSILLTDVSGKNIYNLKNVNKLLENTPGVMGVKTGWTENARENLVTYLERDNHKLMIVVLGSQDRFGETKELINWIFANYDWQNVRAPKLVINTN